MKMSAETVAAALATYTAKASFKATEQKPAQLDEGTMSLIETMRTGRFKFTPAECATLFDKGGRAEGRTHSEELAEVIAKFRARKKSVIEVVDLPACPSKSKGAGAAAWNIALFLNQQGYAVSMEQWYGGFLVDVLATKTEPASATASSKGNASETTVVAECGTTSCAKLADLLKRPHLASTGGVVGLMVVPEAFAGRYAIVFWPVVDLDVPEEGSTALVVAKPASALPTVLDPASSYLARLGASSRRTQRSALERCVRALGGADITKFPWHEMTYEHVRMFLVKLEREGLSLATVNRLIAAFKGALQEARRLGLMNAEQMLAATDALKPKRGQRVAKGRMLVDDELRRILGVCTADKSVLGARDAAMLTLLRFGLRRHEVTGAQLEDLDLEQLTLRIVGKGNKEREIALNKSAGEYLRAWIKVRPKSADTKHRGPILTPMGEVRALTPQSVVEVLKKRAKEAGLDGASFASHDFRRTFISTLLDNGVDIATAQKLAGHGDPATTARYDRRGIEASRAAVEKIKW